MTDAEAENRVLSGSLWKRWIIRLANWGRNTLPYFSFIYTLAITVVENNQ